MSRANDYKRALPYLFADAFSVYKRIQRRFFSVSILSTLKTNEKNKTLSYRRTNPRYKED